MGDNEDDENYDDGYADAGYDDEYTDGIEDGYPDDFDQEKEGYEDHDGDEDDYRQGVENGGDGYHDEEPDVEGAEEGLGDTDEYDGNGYSDSNDQDPNCGGPREEYQYNGLNDHRYGDGYGAFAHVRSQQDNQCRHGEEQTTEDEAYDERLGYGVQDQEGDGHDEEYQAEEQDAPLYQDRSGINWWPGDDEQADASRGYQEFETYNTKGVYNDFLESYPYSPGEHLRDEHEEERRCDFLDQWNEQHGLVYKEEDRWWPTAEELETYDGTGCRRGYSRSHEIQRAITSGCDVDDERLDVIQWLKEARSFEDCARAKQD